MEGIWITSVSLLISYKDQIYCLCACKRKRFQLDQKHECIFFWCDFGVSYSLSELFPYLSLSQVLAKFFPGFSARESPSRFLDRICSLEIILSLWLFKSRKFTCCCTGSINSNYHVSCNTKIVIYASWYLALQNK